MHRVSAGLLSGKELRSSSQCMFALPSCSQTASGHVACTSDSAALVLHLLLSALSRLNGKVHEDGGWCMRCPWSPEQESPTWLVPLPAGVDSSCKTMFVIALLEELIEAGHRALIFSQSRVMLDILQAAIQDRGYTFCRIDGSIASTAERQVTPLCWQT